MKQYIYKSGTVTEKPTIDKPDKFNYGPLLANYYPVHLKEYRDHIASLASYPISEPVEWEDGKVVVEGVDFELKERWKVAEALPTGKNIYQPGIYAIPIKPKKPITIEEMAVEYADRHERRGCSSWLGMKRGYEDGIINPISESQVAKINIELQERVTVLEKVNAELLSCIGRAIKVLSNSEQDVQECDATMVNSSTTDDNQNTNQ